MATDVFPFAVWLSGTNQNSIPANDNALRVEVITGPALSIISAQPASPAEGDQHILGAAPTGAQWATFAEDDVAIFKGGTWLAFEPYQGWLKFNADDGDTYQWDGGWTVFAGGGGGGGAAWGSITGTLSDQTDLQAALDAKAPAGIPQNSQSAAYTLVLSDANKHILHPSADTTARTMTIPANASVAFPVGTAVTFVNQDAAGVMTIAITTDTMRLAGAGTTGSRTLAANGMATALKITSTEWIISGTGLT